MPFSIRTRTNADEVRRKLDFNRWVNPINLGLKDVTDLLTTESKANAPVDTGNLQGSIHKVIRYRDRLLEARVTTFVPYAIQASMFSRLRGRRGMRYFERAIASTRRRIAGIMTERILQGVRRP